MSDERRRLKPPLKLPPDRTQKDGSQAETHSPLAVSHPKLRAASTNPINISTSSIRLRRLTVSGTGTPIPTSFFIRSQPHLLTWCIPCDPIETDKGTTSWTIAGTLPLAAFAEGIDRLDIRCMDEFGAHVLTLPVGRTHAIGLVEHLHNGRLEGWFCRLSEACEAHHALLQLCIDGHPVPVPCEPLCRPDLEDIDFGWGGGFSFRLPHALFDGRERVLTVRAGDIVLPGELRYKTHWIGRIDHFDGLRLIGWIADRNQGLDPDGYQLLTKDGMILNFAATKERPDVAANGGPLYCGFAFELPARLDVAVDDPRIVHASNPAQVIYGAESFLDSRGHVGFARHVISALDGGTELDERDRWWIKRLCSESLAEFRRVDRRLGLGHRFPRPLTPVPREQTRFTAVIIPVYDGYDDTIACLRSVHDALRKEAGCRVVVIDDRGPDRRLNQELPQLCRRLGFQLLRNPENLGFVASVNRGIAAFPNDDVLLLNSDTIVPPHFVRRMRSHLRDRGIASVTPFSNNATILSYPMMNVENVSPAIDDVLELDSVFDRANRGRSLDVPTAVGFCMLMRRDVIDRIGVFDPIWNKGYCE